MLEWFLLSGLTQKTCIPTRPTMKMNTDICRYRGTSVYAGWHNSLSLATLQGTCSPCIQHVLMLKLYGKVQLHCTSYTSALHFRYNFQWHHCLKRRWALIRIYTHFQGLLQCIAITAT